MNQGFKLRFDQMRESDPTSADDASPDQSLDTQHPQPSFARNLGLVWPDGRRMFVNYAYLLAGEFEPNQEKNSIKLSFSAYTVLLEGYGLERLFMALLDHLPRLITATDPRYVLEEDQTGEVVMAIKVEKKEG